MNYLNVSNVTLASNLASKLVEFVTLMSLLSAASPQSLAICQPGERLRPGDRRTGPREDLQVSRPLSSATSIHPCVTNGHFS